MGNRNERMKGKIGMSLNITIFNKRNACKYVTSLDYPIHFATRVRKIT